MRYLGIGDGYVYAALDTDDGFDMYRAAVKTNATATANPAAGADPATITCPANTRMKILTAVATLVASADVATRIPMLSITDGSTTIFTANLSGTQTASQTVIHNFAVNVPSVNTGSYRLGTLPDLWLEPGWTMSIATSNIQAADDWTALAYSYLSVI